MGKYDYTIEICMEKIKELHGNIKVIYEREAGNMGSDLKITAEDCKEWVSQLKKKIDELYMAIKIIERF